MSDRFNWESNVYCPRNLWKSGIEIYKEARECAGLAQCISLVYFAPLLVSSWAWWVEVYVKLVRNESESIWHSCLSDTFHAGGFVPIAIQQTQRYGEIMNKTVT